MTTALPECRSYRSVLVAENREQYVEQLRIALEKKHDPDYLEVLQREAKENTWDARVEAILTPLLADADLRERHGIGGRFPRAVRRHFSPNKGHPMYDIWLEFALSTNRRGLAAVETVQRYTSVPGKRVLDVGCAYGGFAIAFAKSGGEAVGIDIDPALLELAADNVHDMGAAVSLYRKDITDWTHLKDLGAFDIITCNDLIEHVDDVRGALEHIAFLLKPGGHLYLQIPNACSVGQVLKDGHYGLFGITLLSRQDAIRYFSESGYNDSYGVGYFHRLGAYIEMLGQHRIALHNGEILNSSESLKERIDRMRPSLELIRNRLSGCLDDNGLSVETKQALTDAVNEYVDQVTSDFRAYDATADEGLKSQRAWGLVKSYDIEFWEMLCVKGN